MKKFGLLTALFITLCGCSAADLERIKNDTLNAAYSSAMGTLGSGASHSNSSDYSAPASHSVESVDIHTSDAKKTRRNLGKITVVKTEKNPKGQTQLILEGCSHPRIGNLRCGGYVFEVSGEGWLIDNPIPFDDLNHPQVVVPAGAYYLKFSNWDSGRNRFSTGEFNVTPFVSNYVFVELE